MTDASQREEIRKWMEAKKAGRSTGGKEMRYDPKRRKFVVVDQGSAEHLPIVDKEDLKAFVASFC